jgi:ATP-dependent RNA helicase DeaD
VCVSKFNFSIVPEANQIFNF